MQIEIISGSPRKNSVSYRVALHLKKALDESTEHRIGLIDVREWKLPEIQQVFSSVDKTPEEFRPLTERIFAAQGIILVSPEYNGSYSPSMKNLLDHFPKQRHKAFGIVTASPGAMGGIRAAQQMHLLVAALFGVASPYMLIVPGVEKKFDPDGKLLDPAFENTVHNFLTEYLWLAERMVKEKEREKV
ncbi:MAG TPA: NAD(P)H-dependent oxidoreductase [Chitinophagaceae bacterium]|nr:NAD(P)H-dependent oxidoreductase [Chitinophagaceae bacterium]